MKNCALAFWLMITAFSPAYARHFTQSDLAYLSQIGDATASSDGKWLVWEQATDDPHIKGTQHVLWRLDLANSGSEPEKMAFLDDSAPSAPAFSADGMLYFLSERTSSMPTIFRMSMDDTKPTAVLASEDLAGFRISPRGDAVLVWARRPPHTRFLDDKTGIVQANGGARVFDQLPIRHWNQWEDGNRSQLFLLPLHDGQAIGPGCAVAPTLVGDVPSQPSGGKEETAWGADGKSIYFSLRAAGPIEPLSTNTDIYAASADCANEPIDLTAANAAADQWPAVSPDGRWLAWLATSRPGYADDRRVVWLRELATGKAHPLTQAWDRSPDAILWSPDSTTLYATANDTLDHPVFSIDVADEVVRRLTTAGHLVLIAAEPDGSLILKKDGLVEPPNLWRRSARGKLTRLTNANAAKLAGVEWPKVLRFKFAGAGGDEVNGIVLRPPGLAPGKKAPVVLIVHGGPQSSLGDIWYPRWPLNPTLYAEHGYGVVSVDFHGSTGYGQAFTDSVNRNWGGKPLEDLQLGLATAIERFTFLDGDNACAVGASYGGYMMNWIEGHWPGRFNCIVQHDGIFDERGMTYETDELAQDHWDFGNRPYYVDPVEYERWNPVNAVAQWRTPQLVITGEKDFRSPTGQAVAAFTALQERSIPSRLLVFPDEGHYEARAVDSIQWYDEVFKWLDEWTSKAAAGAQSTQSTP
ncbi:Prolyl tripeptidyl peptidase [Dyella sp. AD56]|uniref:S9 family peptidase n=1 Tax=Dyella sp. AD56 TaxID=1528744 RepID=UPI000C858B00|nr:S9 family peptidase [Dyella sp. AD56]PMQ04649.1 Prolyl tripeptidyl peptidase [Dyella sp. AD56]